MGNFKVGDVCETIDPNGEVVFNKHCLGIGVTIIGELGSRVINGEQVYSIRYSGGGTGWAAHRCLRLKRPPNKDEFTAGEWSLCPWSPYRVGELVK